MAYEKTLAHFTPEQTKPFAKIVLEVSDREELGTIPCAEWFGVSRIVIMNLLEQQKLTDKQARIILAAYKQKKHTLKKKSAQIN